MSVGVTNAKIASGTKGGIRMKTPSPWAMTSHSHRAWKIKALHYGHFSDTTLAAYKPRNRDWFTSTFFMFLQIIFNTYN